MSAKRAVIYARVSTTQQNVDNQLLELRQTAKRFGWSVVSELIDDGISGAKGRSDRPAFDRLFQMVQRKECDVVMAWDVSRLGRSIQDLVSFMNEVQAAGVDLFIHQQAINTATAAGRMVFGIFSALASYERELIRERVMLGLARVKKEGKRLGRPSVCDSPQLIAAVKLLREKQTPIHKIASSCGVGVGTVSKILKAA